MQNHMRKQHLGNPMKRFQPNFQGKICCPSCHVLYSSDVEFLDHVCLTCYNYITRVYEEKASEYLRKFKPESPHVQIKQQSIPDPINENTAKMTVESESLCSFKLGSFLVVTNPNFDLKICDEPYVAIMLIYNLESGKFMSRIWNQTVEVGWAYESNELEEACQRLFKQGKPCLGVPIDEHNNNDTLQDVLVSFTPIPRIVSKSCSKFLGISNTSNNLSCQECQKLTEFEVTNEGDIEIQDTAKNEDIGEAIDVKQEVIEDDFSHDLTEVNE